MPGAPDLAARLLRHAGSTFADEAGITLHDTPKPLFQLLVLTMLASKPIGAEVAVSAAAEVFRSGLRTPDAVLHADRSTMIDAFGRAGYARYDESSATRLTALAARVHDRYGGDLRKLAAESEGDTDTAARALQQFDGVGPTGADIYLREVQDVWPWVQPYFDDRAVAGARQLGLPTEPARLLELSEGRPAQLAAALVRVALDDELRDRVTA
ncbi:endonuclease [Mycolicibacterium sp. 120266]|uniref:endonuclease n=1 Tax=Mycolicibacterium sp. 120266 TaxID=3090601 RepID=UPI00299EA791|nr:endonuclease [Mycolicibacterium sp. 120266]MDX1872397.1 endonuclease [Mycolicibacterium sp. 120266]